ncbi:MAG: hypothetical protein ACE5HG_01585 [Candidatus Bathyarchaeia archaeon]
MKLQRHISRVVGKTEYFKWVIVIPSPQINELGWKEGEELQSRVKGNSLTIMPMTSPGKSQRRRR